MIFIQFYLKKRWHNKLGIENCLYVFGGPFFFSKVGYFFGGGFLQSKNDAKTQHKKD